ncbi:MAG: hypothetical protein ACFCVK_20705 [Acidimicrobiales bacterium]
MNAGGHIAVLAAAGVGPGDAASRSRLLGAALPDLAAMGRFRLLGRTDDPAVTAGIRFHHRTDDAFHHHPWFHHRHRRLAAALDDAGLGRGAARACSHVGIELLLDGELLTLAPVAAATDGAFDAITDVARALDGLVASDHRPRWREHLDLLADHRLPRDYDDPGAVAARLHRILTRRPRLAFDATHIATLAQHLALAQDDIAATGPALVAELAARLAPLDAGTPRRP